MKEYWFNDFQDKAKYINFINYMLKNSDTFSLVYFRYTKSEKVKKTLKEVKQLLRPFLIKSWYGNEWASMITMNQFNHIYQIAMYRATPEASKALQKVNSLFEWDYPQYPMDLCFFKNGYAWFASCSHERYAFLYTNDKKVCLEFEQLGASFMLYNEIDEKDLFFDKNAVLS